MHVDTYVAIRPGSEKLNNANFADRRVHRNAVVSMTSPPSCTWLNSRLLLVRRDNRFPAGDVSCSTRNELL